MYAQIENEAEKIMASIGLIRSSLVLGPIAIFCHNRKVDGQWFELGMVRSTEQNLLCFFQSLYIN